MVVCVEYLYLPADKPWAVGCGVCDTPELWRGATGLCARVRACAGAAESLPTYIHTSRLSLGCLGLFHARLLLRSLGCLGPFPTGYHSFVSDA